MTEIVNRTAGIWLDWQWAMLWQTAMLIGIVAIIDRLIHKRAWPQLRYALWLLVLIKLVLPPSLTSPVSVTSRVSPLAWKAVEGGMQARPASADSEAAGSPTGPAATQTPPAVMPATARFTQGTAGKANPAETRPELPAVAETKISWTVYAMGLWLAGVSVLAMGLRVRMGRLSREHAASQPRDVPDWFDGLVAQTAAELGLRRAPQVVFSDKVCCPAVFGVFRPVLLLPSDSPPTTQQETRHVLLHELAHIKRGDLLVHAGYMILVTIYWINPLLWLIRKHIQNLRELCCDATVAAHLREETDAYRETLLATGRALLARPVDPGLGLLGLFENSGWLLIRLQWLQRKTWRHPWLRRASVAAVAILMFCCILPMATLKATGGETSFKVTLPDGITVELVGVRKPGSDQWWRPDGTPLAEAPYDSSEEGRELSNPYEFAVRYDNLPEGVSGGIGVKPDKLKPHKAGRPVEEMAYILVSQMPETETVTVRVDLATGEWATEESEMLNRGSSGEWSWHMWPSPTLDAIVGPAMPYEENGRVYATLFYALNDPRDQKYDARLIAVDLNNVEHQPVGGGGVGWYFNSSTSNALAHIGNEFDLPLKGITAFNLQTRPRTWIEFKNVSLRPGKTGEVEIITTRHRRPAVADKPSQGPATARSAAEERSSDQAFKVTLGCGATLELIGIRKSGTDQWWHPDGTPLANVPYDSSEETNHSNAYEVALRYENLPDGASGGLDIDRHVWGGSIPMWYAKPQKAGKPVEGVSYAIGSLLPDMETTTVKVQLATGSWKTDETHARSREWNACACGGKAIHSTIFSVPYEREGKTYATVTYAAPKGNEYDVRLTALDVYNVEHQSDYRGGLWTSAGFKQITPDFNLPLDDVAAFQLQVRPYTWIEFRNVCLQPGKHQKVEIVTTEPNQPAAEVVKRGKPPEGFSSWRDNSSQVLQAFHAACTGYLKERPGSDLPKRPWSLRFRLPKQVFVNGHYEDGYVGPVQYVTATGYFRPGGFPSLKREDFESSEASRTPILYCRDLLGQEDGKGTNVLFGDGRVEYVTAEGLDRLKAAAAASDK
jgi:prepilin-type processing-associated H-X9-DG protein